MKKALLFFALLCGLFLNLGYSAPGWQWARASSCSSFLGGSEGWLAKCDPSNNVFMAGFYYGDSICIGTTVYRNPVNPTNNVQTLLVKYDSAGNILWSRAGKNGESRPISITTDHKGNLYVFGYFTTDSIRFENELLVNPSFNYSQPTSNACYYLLKYDETGNLLWATHGDININPDGDYLRAGGMAADASGDIYISTTFNKDTFKTGGFDLVNANTNSTNDIFIAKYNTSGNLLWVKSFGGTKDDYVLDMACNGNRVFMTGYFRSGVINFGSYRLFNSSKKGYVACMDINGNVLWAQSTGGKGIARSAATDKYGHVYIAGGFTDTLAFDTYNIYSATGGFFLTRYDSAGSMQTPKLFKPTASMVSCCNVYSMTTDACSNIWVSINMEPDKGISLDSSTTAYPIGGSIDPTMIAGYDINGKLIDHMLLPTAGGYNSGLSNTGLAADNKGNIFFTGDFRVVDPFIIGDALHLYDGQQTNIFIAKYQTSSECVEPLPPVYPSVPVIKVYPSPAGTESILSYTGDLSGGNATMSLRDISGRLIRVYPLTTQLTPFSVADLACGTYMCMVYVPGREIYTLRLVVLR